MLDQVSGHYSALLRMEAKAFTSMSRPRPRTRFACICMGKPRASPYRKRGIPRLLAEDGDAGLADSELLHELRHCLADGCSKITLNLILGLVIQRVPRCLDRAFRAPLPKYVVCLAQDTLHSATHQPNLQSIWSMVSYNFPYSFFFFFFRHELLNIT